MALRTRNDKDAKLPILQLTVLSLCRFAEPIALTSVFPYLPEMIESFDVPKNDVAEWAGTTSLVFSLAQAATSIQWGRASDRYGRKPIVLTALFCAMITGLLFGFSQSLNWAITARALAGASNASVGILRTVVAELVPQKHLQPTAFSVMPIIWSVGQSIGPTMGGALAVPTRQYPSLFAGNAFFEKYKFALPNMVASIFFTVGLATGFLFLNETSETKKHRKDYGLVLGDALIRRCCGRQVKPPRRRNADQEATMEAPGAGRKISTKQDVAPGWGEVFTRQSSLNIIAYTIMAFHAVTFDQLVPVFLHHPPQDHSPSSGNVQLPFKFAGGLGLPSERIGFLYTMMGVAGILTQFTVFGPLTRRFGSLRCFRTVTALFPVLYFIIPYAVLLPTQKSREAAVLALMFVKGIISTVAFPWTTILLTNSANTVRVLGTLNGVAVGTSAIGRAVGPFTAGSAFSWGVKRGYMIVPWFTLGIVAIVGHTVSWWLIEMDGPKSSVEGDEPDVDHAGEEEGEEEGEETVLIHSQADHGMAEANGLRIEGIGLDDAKENEAEELRSESSLLLPSRSVTTATKATSYGSSI